MYHMLSTIKNIFTFTRNKILNDIQNESIGGTAPSDESESDNDTDDQELQDESENHGENRDVRNEEVIAIHKNFQQS